MANELTRRAALRHLALGAAVAGLWPRRLLAEPPTPIVVYKDPSCGCCHQWVEYLKKQGFSPSVTDTSGMTGVKSRYHVPDKLASCHTAVVGGYVIEGHVPAPDIRRLLAAKPKNVTGLTIPGMPASAPGMDGTPFQAYTVLSFDAKGATTVFAQHDRA